MTRRKDKEAWRSERKLGTQQQTQLVGQDMTPGRAPAEGDDEIATPSHERWEQDTFDRDPAEG